MDLIGAIINTCDLGHKFYYEQGSQSRCPFCLVIGLAEARKVTSLTEALRERGAYEVLWEVATWMETELAQHLAPSRPDFAQRMKDGAAAVKQAANNLLI